MRQLIKHFIKSATAMSLFALLLLIAPESWAKGASSAGQAAAQARSAYGGKVLSSKDNGGSYKVKLLLDGGRVKTVNISKESKSRDSKSRR